MLQPGKLLHDKNNNKAQIHAKITDDRIHINVIIHFIIKNNNIR